MVHYMHVTTGQNCYCDKIMTMNERWHVTKGFTFDLDSWPTDMNIDIIGIIYSSRTPNNLQAYEAKCSRVIYKLQKVLETDLPTD